jgi:hypothetical protein
MNVLIPGGRGESKLPTMIWPHGFRSGFKAPGLNFRLHLLFFP